MISSSKFSLSASSVKYSQIEDREDIPQRSKFRQKGEEKSGELVTRNRGEGGGCKWFWEEEKAWEKCNLTPALTTYCWPAICHSLPCYSALSLA